MKICENPGRGLSDRGFSNYLPNSSKQSKEECDSIRFSLPFVKKGVVLFGWNKYIFENNDQHTSYMQKKEEKGDSKLSSHSVKY